MNTSSFAVEEDPITQMLTTTAQLKTAQMFLGIIPEMTSDEAKAARDKALDACQEAETDAAYHAQVLQEDLEYLQSLQDKVDEKKLKQAQSLIKQKEELIAKIAAAEEELAGVNVERAKAQLAANALVEERLMKIREENARLREYINQ